MRMFLIDVNKGTAEPVDVEPKLQEYYKLLDCDTIDITERAINGVMYDIIVDDEGLFKNPAIPSAFNESNKKPALVGNLLICLHDSNGDEVGLEEKDVENIKTKLITVTNCEDKKTWIGVFADIPNY